MFEEYRWLKITVSIKPTTTSKDGLYFAGFAYGQDHLPTTTEQISQCSPVVSNTVTKEASLTCSPALLMGGATQWLATAANSGEGKTGIAGYFCLISDVEVAVWVSYTVVLAGPTGVAREADALYGYSTRTRRWADESGTVVTNPPDGSDPVELDIEIDSGDTGVIRQVTDMLQQAYDGFVVAHQMVVDGITYIHAAAHHPITRYVLGALAAPVIVHHRALPFRNRIQLRFINSDFGETNSRPPGKKSTTCGGKCSIKREEQEPGSSYRTTNESQ